MDSRLFAQYSCLQMKLQIEVRRSFYSYYAAYRGLGSNIKLILIIGHMRAGSTLLTHLIGSIPEVIGFGETHLPYLNDRDFRAVAGKILFVTRVMNSQITDRTIFLDKVLHSYLLGRENIDLFNRPNVKIIFLIREPHGTIASMVRTFSHLDQWNTQESAAEYYTNRLASLAHLADCFSQIEKRTFRVTYGDLVNNTELTLKSLSSYLDTGHALSAEYNTKTLDKTGKKGGDPSQNIMRGKIIKTKKLPFDYDKNLIAHAINIYDQNLSKMNTICMRPEATQS